MATTHVYIVDTNTFRYHLEYLFSGTGSKDNFIDFNNNPNSNLFHTTENNLVSMLADSQRVRKGDYVIFYLQQNFKDGVKEGKFYGIFRIAHNLSFLDNNDERQFLRMNLKKSLTFRALIRPFEVYENGVTEWEALDEIKNIQSPNQMLWSLIYRKLKGNRGNTMITIYEADRLFQLIRNKNGANILKSQNFSFDKKSQKILISEKSRIYTGRKLEINILPRLIRKFKENKSFEAHLQAYIVQNIQRGTNLSLDASIIPRGTKLEWMGNEVSCGVGMQRIDILLSLAYNEHSRVLIPIEIKSIRAYPDIIYQMQRYVNWIEQYYLPNRPSGVQPVIISMKIIDKNSMEYRGLIAALKNFNKLNKNHLPIKYIEFEIINNEINFRNIVY